MATTTRPVSYETLAAAKRDGSLTSWLADMTPAERVEAAEVCAANSRRSVSEWLVSFGELIEQAEEIAPAPRNISLDTQVLDGDGDIYLRSYANCESEAEMQSRIARAREFYAAYPLRFHAFDYDSQSTIYEAEFPAANPPAELDELTVYCEACGKPVDPALAVLDGEQMVCQGCAPCSVAEFERMQQEAAELALEERAAGYDSAAALAEQRAEWSAPAGAASAIARADIFDALCQSADELRDYWRDVPKRLEMINAVWEAMILAETFYFDARGNLLVESSTPGKVYAVGHTCPCAAGHWGNHCRHSVQADIIGRARRIARMRKAA